MISKLQLLLACCITTNLCACATDQLDMTTKAIPIDRISTIEEKYWQSLIEEIDGTSLPFSRAGTRVIIDPGKYQITVSCWNGKERLPFPMEINVLEGHHYVAKCEVEYGWVEEQWWVEIIDENTKEKVNKSRVTLIPIELIENC